MPTLSAVQNRLDRLIADKNCPVSVQIVTQLARQNYQGRLEPEFIARCCRTFNLSPVELALYCVAIAACYALVPISRFCVGAVAVGRSGTFYFGANQEFSAVAIQHTIHAEQSALSHAWLAGEKGITDIAVNTTPCGHCRQFMNELNSAGELKIHLPHRHNNSLHDYLPDAFGPKNLNIERLLFDEQRHPFQAEGDELIQSAVLAAQQSYAPYSGAMSGVALQAGERIICGRYAENAAFNPSLLPLQSALNYRRFTGLADNEIRRIVMAEKQAVLSHRAVTEELAASCPDLPEIEYIAL